MKGPGADQHYWEALAQGRFEMQQCNGCKRWNWPAVWRCGECGSWEQTWQAVPLEGRIFTWTRTWHNFGAPSVFQLPFVSVVVEIPGAGNRRVYGSLAESPDQPVAIGASVRGEIIAVEFEGRQIPALRWHIADSVSQQQGAAA